jgi:ferredoxin
MILASWFLLALGGLSFLFLLSFAAVSVREREPRAATVSAILAAGLGALFVGLALLPDPVPIVGAVCAASAAVLAALILLFGPNPAPAPGGRPSRRVDERDIMFARGRLQPGSQEYAQYYAMRPENRSGDDHTRSLPGLLSPAARLAEPLSFAAADASFDLTEVLRLAVNGEVADSRVERSADEFTAEAKRLARSFGAVDVGVTAVKPYHVYTNIGRGTGEYGAPVELRHPWAVAFTVEMNYERVSHAPAAPVVEESARQYVEGAAIGVVLGGWMRRLGYAARAHTDGNYRVIAPLVARDAGLGEIGRMGLLMTPRLGPRVRLGVVTTEMPLVADATGDNPSVLDFCRRCKKCATNCPVGAISDSDRTPVDAGLRWEIDSETCFRYWNVVGTDCAICMRVCPYSHPDNPAHNMVRRLIRRSGPARQSMLWLDDLFYGARPTPIDTIER